MKSVNERQLFSYSLGRSTRWLVLLAAAFLMNNVVWYAMSQDIYDHHALAPSAPQAWEFDVAGITRPSLCRPDDVMLSGDERVIGVEVDHEARAYVVRAFELKFVKSPSDCGVHLVSDSVAGRPVWVTHCDRMHSTRVFTSMPDNAAHNVRIGGWSDGLMLKVDDRRFMQNDRSLPLEDAEYTVTSWQKWLTRHPETLVYTGSRCSQDSGSQAR